MHDVKKTILSLCCLNTINYKKSPAQIEREIPFTFHF